MINYWVCAYKSSHEIACYDLLDYTYLLQGYLTDQRHVFHRELDNGYNKIVWWMVYDKL